MRGSISLHFNDKFRAETVAVEQVAARAPSLVAIGKRHRRQGFANVLIERSRGRLTAGLDVVIFFAESNFTEAELRPI